MRRFLAAISLVVLVSCSPPAVVPPGAVGPVSTNPTVSRSLAVADQSLTLALNLARRYTDLPRCDTTTVRLCSDRAKVRQIRELAIQAHEALMTARLNEAMIGPALAAIETFRSIVPAT